MSDINTSLSARLKFLVIFFSLTFVIVICLWNPRRTKNVFQMKSKMNPKDALPYYFKIGTVYPKPAKFSAKLGRRDAKLLPFEDPDSDRVENQFMFVPPNYEEIRKSNKTKSIVFYNGVDNWWFVDLKKPKTFFSDKKCPVSTCTISAEKTDVEKADFVMVSGGYISPPPINVKRKPNQIYGFFTMESPVRYGWSRPNSSIYNWTMTYRHDSTIAIPYYKWAYYDPNVKELPQTINYAANKTKKVALLVSDCIRENDRINLAIALQKYIQVDIYGRCGNLSCTDCFAMLERDYKFYLAIENSNCADYITEKLYRNALQHNVLPIVYGARREDYERQAPRGSYILYEDFASLKALAEYLHKLDKDDNLYNSYFQWKGTGEFLEGMTNFWCRLCAMFHDDYSTSPRWYKDVNKWWLDEKLWRRGLWRDST